MLSSGQRELIFTENTKDTKDRGRNRRKFLIKAAIMFPRTASRRDWISFPREKENSWLASRSAVTSPLKDIKLIAWIYGARIARGGILEFSSQLASIARPLNKLLGLLIRTTTAVWLAENYLNTLSSHLSVLLCVNDYLFHFRFLHVNCCVRAY